jgi:hypothetical protein
LPEPSILDFLKNLIKPRHNARLDIPQLPLGGKKSSVKNVSSAIKSSKQKSQSELRMPWKAPATFLLFMIAQVLWAPPTGNPIAGLMLAAIATALSIWSLRTGEWRIPLAAKATKNNKKLLLRPLPLMIAFISFTAAFYLFGGNQFTFANFSLWIIAVLSLLASFWDVNATSELWKKLRARLSIANLKSLISWRALIVLAALLLIAFFRFGQLNEVPFEMVSDHAEKLMDVQGILDGNSPIFFERNTGREPLQFYLTAWIANWMRTGISFLSLKLGTTLLGFISLYYVYQLAKDFGGKWVGLIAILITAFAFWPNVLARTGLRFIFYPAFVAPFLTYFLRALRGKGNNNFLLAGIFLGVGLMGYTAFRIVPLVAVIGLIIYMIHSSSSQQKKQSLIGFSLLVLVATFIFTPLARYAFEENSFFNYRINSRFLISEIPYPDNPILIFIGNTGRALIMPVYDAGSIWLVGLIQRPALDILSGALFMIGSLIISIRYIRKRDCQDIFLLFSVPMLMLPSILSLAFPNENPALNRAGGAMVPIFIICAIGLDALVHGIKDKLGKGFGMRGARISAAIILTSIAALNYDMVFRQYADSYRNFSWNSSELGGLISDFSNTNGGSKNSWVIAYPHWVDTRLVGINAGFPRRDFGIWPDELEETLANQQSKLFLLNLQDGPGMDALIYLYPNGTASVYESSVEGKDFFVYTVPSGNLE